MKTASRSISVLRIADDAYPDTPRRHKDGGIESHDIKGAIGAEVAATCEAASSSQNTSGRNLRGVQGVQGVGHKGASHPGVIVDLRGVVVRGCGRHRSNSTEDRRHRSHRRDGRCQSIQGITDEGAGDSGVVGYLGG
jgi:hypothetical protein